MSFFHALSGRRDTSFVELVRNPERHSRFLDRQKRQRMINFIVGGSLLLLGIGLMLAHDAPVNTALALLGTLQIAIALHRDLCIKLVILTRSDPAERDSTKEEN